MKRKQNLCFIITVVICGIIMIALCQPGVSARIRELQQTALLSAAEERSYAANPEDPTNPANPEDPTNPANPEEPSQPANPEDITLEIFDGDSMDVYVSAGKKTFFRFVAPRSGNFVLYSTGDDDTYGYLYASDARTELAWDDDYYDCNFRLEYYFTGGETYFFAVEFYGGWNSGTISVTLEHEHVWESRVITEATCSAPGEMEDVCLICGRTERYSYYVEHAWDEGEVLQEAACTLQRIVKFTCTVCGEAFYEFGDALGHSWNDGVVTKEPSCAEYGIVLYTCTVCGDTNEETLPPRHTDENGDGVCDLCGSEVYAVTDTGMCGDSLTYVLYENGLLEIRGMGDMYHYGYPDSAPWGQNVTSVDFGSGITRIGACAFMYCDQLSSVTIPEGVTQVAVDAFMYCSALQSVSLPDTLRMVGAWAFYGCRLSSVSIPISMMSISESAFSYSGLSDVYFKITEAQARAYGFTDDIFGSAELHFAQPVSSGVCGDSLTWTLCDNGLLIIDGEGIMYGCEPGEAPWGDQVTCVMIPSGIVAIAEYVFSDCNGLTDVYLDMTREEWLAKDIPDCVFPDSAKLHFVECVGSGVCGDHLTWTEYSNGLLVITGTGPMYDYDPMDGPVTPWSGCVRSVEIRPGVTYLGSNAFYEISSLVSVSVPDSVTGFGSQLFLGCKNLTAVRIPEGVTQLPHGVFWDCCSLTEILIPDSVTVFGDYAFMGCSGLTSLHIPAGTNIIGSMAFSGCSGLESITVADDNEVFCSVGNCVIRKTEKTLVVGCKNSVIPADGSVTRIGEQAFEGQSDLTGIVIPHGVTRIEAGAFYACTSLCSLEIPVTVTDIGYAAFVSCNALTDVYYAGTEEAWEYVNIEEGNNSLLNAEIHFGTDPGPGQCDHVWDDGVVIEEATCMRTGRMEYTCTLCGVKRYAVIPQGHVDADEDYICDRCGRRLYDFKLGEHVYGALEDAVLTIFGYGAISDEWRNYEYGESPLWSYYYSVIRIGRDITYIPNGEFMRNTEYTEITVEEGNPVYHSENNCLIETASYTLLIGCKNSVIPADGSVKHITGDAFWSSEIETVDIPEGVESIANYAFSYCDMLTSVTVSASVTEIGNNAFYDCSNLETFTVAEGNPVYHSENNCLVETASGTLLLYCKNAAIPTDGSVTRIGAGAFGPVAGTEVDITLPAAVESIVSGAFPYGYRNITLRVLNRDAEIEENAIPARAVIYGYEGSTAEDYALSHGNTFIVIHEHIWDEGEVTVSPTCEENGTKLYTCTECGETYTEEIPALGHDYVNHEGQAATCLEDGWKPYQTCTRCDYTSYEKIDALGHDYVDHEGQAATCLEYGWKPYQTCTRCDYTSYEKIDALGHDYGEWTQTTDPTCTEAGVETRYCSRCDATETRPVEERGHDYIGVVTEPTCTEDGCTTYTCSRCGDSYTADETDALGHDYVDHDGQAATCLADGWKPYQTCSRCDYTSYEKIDALGHNYVDHDGQAATCLADGWQPYQTCSRCDYTSYEKIDALGHDYGEWTQTTNPTCTEAGVETRYCSRCDATETRPVEERGHDYIGVVTEPTCTEDGYTTYTCSRCGDSYTADETDALGHDYVNHEGQAATCLTDGWKSYQTCTRCDYTSYEKIDALGHDYVNHDGQSATCLEDGWKPYQTCTRCDYTSFEKINALGHDYVDHDGQDATCLADGWKPYQTCTRCDYTNYEKIDALGHDLIPHEAKEATCTDAGWKAYDTCSRCDYTTYVEIPALTHNWGEWENNTATCIAGGTEMRECSRCHETESRNTAALRHDYVNHEGQAATCLADGWKPYQTCTRCDYTSYEKIDALGHDYVDHEGQAATCLADGWKPYQTCTRCDYTSYEKINALGHDYVDHGGQTATCTEIGWKAYKTCSRCDYTTYEEISALGHDYVEHTAKAATCTEIGWDTYQTCSRCDYTTYKEIAALGHDYVDHDAKAATCTGIGWKAYKTCSRCDYTSYEELPALGHDYGDWLQTQAPSCTEKGEEKRTCSRCDATETRTVDALTHKFTALQSDATSHWYACANGCGMCTEKETHSFGEWITDVPATTEQEGTAHRICVSCQYKETKTLPKEIEAYLFGDVNHDGKVTAADARLALRKAVELEHYEEGSYEFLVSDVNFDGKVTAADARLILRAAVNLEDPNTWLEEYRALVSDTMSELSLSFGDVDRNTRIEPADARLALRISLGLLQDGTQTMDEVNKLATDVDVDGEVNPGDARLILRKSLGLDVASEGWNDV